MIKLNNMKPKKPRPKPYLINDVQYRNNVSQKDLIFFVHCIKRCKFGRTIVDFYTVLEHSNN